MGRRKRQTLRGRAPTFEDLTFTDEQRDFCNNERTCLYDLLLTGDMEIATTTRKGAEESARILSLISEYYSVPMKTQRSRGKPQLHRTCSCYDLILIFSKLSTKHH